VHTSFDGLGDTGEDISNRVGRALDALRLVRRSLVRWKMCWRFEIDEDFGVAPRGRRKDGNPVAFDALDASVDDMYGSVGPGWPLMSASRDIVRSQHRLKAGFQQMRAWMLVRVRKRLRLYAAIVLFSSRRPPRVVTNVVSEGQVQNMLLNPREFIISEILAQAASYRSLCNTYACPDQLCPSSIKGHNHLLSQRHANTKWFIVSKFHDMRQIWSTC